MVPTGVSPAGPEPQLFTPVQACPPFRPGRTSPLNSSDSLPSRRAARHQSRFIRTQQMASQIPIPPRSRTKPLIIAFLKKIKVSCRIVQFSSPFFPVDQVLIYCATTSYLCFLLNINMSNMNMKVYKKSCNTLKSKLESCTPVASPSQRPEPRPRSLILNPYHSCDQSPHPIPIP